MEKAGKQGIFVENLGSMAAVGLGLAVFYATGLAEAESGWFKALLGTGTVLWMTWIVRLGMSGDR